jgi:hypothetical protein
MLTKVSLVAEQYLSELQTADAAHSSSCTLFSHLVAVRQGWTYVVAKLVIVGLLHVFLCLLAVPAAPNQGLRPPCRQHYLCPPEMQVAAVITSDRIKPSGLQLSQEQFSRDAVRTVKGVSCDASDGEVLAEMLLLRSGWPSEQPIRPNNPVQRAACKRASCDL